MLNGRLAWTARLPALALLLLAAGLAGCGGRSRVAASAHARVACVGCHSAGAGGLERGGVPDAACASERCHPGGGPDSASVRMVRFAHARHPAAGGRTVPCAACHDHEGGDARRPALPAGASACALCHYADIATTRDTGCAACHQNPRHTRETSEGVALPHPMLLSAGVPCTRCHYQLIEGDTAVAGVRCPACHGPAGGADAVDTTVTADAAHAAHRDVACAACHQRITHRVVAMSTSIVLQCLDCHAAKHRRPIPADTARVRDCNVCHHGAHAEEQRLMLGLTQADSVRPSAMFLAGVTCRSCHAASGRPPVRPGQALLASSASCTGCHGGEWSGILDRWRRGYARRRGWVRDYLDAASAALGDSAAPPAARARLREASGLLSYLDRAGPMHNLPVVDRTMRRALALAEGAYEAAGRQPPALPELGPVVSSGGCTSCHYGIEEASAGRDSSSGRPVTHADHVLRAGLACDNCHAAGRAPPGISDTMWIDTTRTDRGPRRRSR